jgi:hypothetical protein
MYAYHHLAGDNNEYYSFDNSFRRAVHDMGAGNVKLTPWGTTLEDVINGGLPRLAGFDMSSRMGLSDLFFHNPPNMSSLNKDGIIKMAGTLLGPRLQAIAEEYDRFNTAYESGRLDDWMKFMPVKAVQNVFDAYQAGTSGKVAPSGAQITQPSAGAAVSHVIGFRTNQEARLAEKAETESDYKQWVENRKYNFLKEWTRASPEQQTSVQIKMDAFSAANPGHAITARDMKAAMRGVYTQENEAAGLPGRDPVLNELRDH